LQCGDLAIRAGKSDRRVLHTRRALHQALIALIREKDYNAIAVREILDRANVSRSTFYMHFADKDELLTSGIEQIVTSAAGEDWLTSFSLPILEHHDRHRRTGRMNASTRKLLHDRLRLLIARRIRDAALRPTTRARAIPGAPPDLLAQFVASTFIVVLGWWLDARSRLSPREVYDMFCLLIGRALHGAPNVRR
jgi:AcrR family transcriptional regulator